jgi:dTDP-4-amino-4,6-dideoxygalactose transaminase
MQLPEVMTGSSRVKVPVYVTQPYLPPLKEFEPFLREIWNSEVLTNGGPFHQRLEEALCAHLGAKHLALFANGTLGLVTALQTLRITGEVSSREPAPLIVH